MQRKIVAFSAMLGILTSVQAQLTTDVAKNNYESFELSGVPSNLSVKNGELSLSKMKHVEGKKSLKWNWEANSFINIKKDIDTQGRVKIPKTPVDSEDTFGIWVYSPEKYNGKLNFAFEHNGKEVCNFNVNMNFQGWRTIWVAYNRDLKVDKNQKIDNIRITSPNGNTSGTLYFDSIFYSFMVDARHNTPDLQIPFIRDGKTIGHGEPKLEVIDLGQKMDDKYSNQPLKVSVEDIKKIANRVDNLGKRYDIKDSTMATYRKNYKFFNIIGEKGNVQAKYLLTNSQFKESFLKLTDSKFDNISNHESLAKFEDFTRLMFNIAQTYKLAKDTPQNQAKKAELKQMFLNMAAVLTDQGWAFGSAQGTTHHFGYSARNYYYSIFLMREELEKAGMLKDLSGGLIYYLNTDNILYPNNINHHIIMDTLNTEILPIFQSILAMENGKRKDIRLVAFKEYVEALIQHTKANKNGFKADGTMFHHEMHYSGYGLPAIRGAINIVKNLQGTSIEISDENYDLLKNILMRTSIWATPDFGFMAIGRHPITGIFEPYIPMYQDLALNQPSSRMAKSKYDVELMREYARLLKLYKGKDCILNGEKINPAENPQGAFSFNYAGAGILRSGKTTVAIKGYNQLVKPYEIYGNDNRYGRYQSHGTIQIFKDGVFKNGGHLYDGWDWSRPAGATTLNLTPDEIEHSKTAFYGANPIQKANFGGSANLDNEIGLFGLKLLKSDNNPQALDMYKSVIFYKNMLICFGSNISNDSKKYETQTTLFQNGMDNKTSPIYVNSEKISKFPYEENLNVDDLVVLKDIYNNAYFITKNNDDIKIKRSTQLSKHDKKRTQTKGDFSVVYLSHGVNPKNASYDYLILLDGNENEIKNISKKLILNNKLYDVIQKDKNAHVVNLLNEKVMLYTIFNNNISFTKGLIKRVNVPSLIIAKEINENSYRFSVCVPSVKVNEKKVSFMLAGNWKLEHKNDDVSLKISNGMTEVIVNSQQGRSVTFNLTK